MNERLAIADLTWRLEGEAADETDGDWYELKVATACPPSTGIWLHGGWWWWGESESAGYGFYLPTWQIDFSDASIIYRLDRYTFDHAGWYMPALVVLRLAAMNPYYYPDTWRATGPPDESVYLLGPGPAHALDEYETAAEAEEAIAFMPDDVAAYRGVVLAVIIFKNNGNVRDECQFERIEPINRGFSYLWRGDVRTVFRC